MDCWMCIQSLVPILTLPEQQLVVNVSSFEFKYSTSGIIASSILPALRIQLIFSRNNPFSKPRIRFLTG